MAHEWKPGDWAMVEIKKANNDSMFLDIGSSGDWGILRELCHPLPPAMTPEERAVIEAAAAYGSYPNAETLGPLIKAARDLAQPKSAVNRLLDAITGEISWEKIGAAIAAARKELLEHKDV